MGGRGDAASERGVALSGFIAAANRLFCRNGRALFMARPSSLSTLGGAQVRVASNPGGQVALAGFVPHGDAILYWHGSEVSASVAADGQELWLQPGSARVAHELGYMLEDPGWITFAGDARRFAFVQGNGREAWHTKSLVVCTIASARCSPLPQPPGSISLDPRWSPHDSRIAFVRARDIGSDGGYGHDLGPFLTNWVEQRTLWLQDTNGGPVQQLERFGHGVYWPRWSRDGKRLMVYRDGDIWLGAPGDTPPKRIVTGLVRPAEFDGGYFLLNHGEVSEDDDPIAWTRG